MAEEGSKSGLFNKNNIALITFALLVAVASAGYLLYLYSQGGATYIANKPDLSNFGKFIGNLGIFTLLLVYSRTALKLILQRGNVRQRLNPVEEQPGIRSFMGSALKVLNTAHPYLGLTTIALIFLHGYLVIPTLDYLPLLPVLGFLTWQGFFGILLKLRYTPSILKAKSYLIHSQLYTGILILILAGSGHVLFLDFHNYSSFHLTGKHASLACYQCHHGIYNGNQATCISCHELPSGHIPGVTGNCDICHSMDGWKPATFDHSIFPLTGKHQSLTCDQCHHGNYTEIAPGCVNCHEMPPGHIPGITGNCDKCHSTDGWKPATFDHSMFPLTGKHALLTCDQCHHGNYTGTAPGCVNCHNPPSNHDGMDTDCAKCHTPDGFTPANFLHIRVGEHIGTNAERPLSCEACHPVRFIDASCTGSHCHSSNNARGSGDD